MLYFFCTCITKLSLLLLLHRIFAVKGSFRVSIYTAEAVVVAFWLSATVANLLDCIPLEWNWKNGNSDPRYCFNYNNVLACHRDFRERHRSGHPGIALWHDI